MRIKQRIISGVVLALAALTPAVAAPRKPHVVVLGAVRKVAYTQAGDPSGFQPGESDLHIRPLLVDGTLREWTTGEAHDVTDRSFVVRRAIRINDALPADAAAGSSPEKPASGVSRWVWQRGPWLLVDRVTGHIAALKLPDYDPGISQVAWFRDYAAYCGVTASGKNLYAVVAQVAGRKPLLAKKIAGFEGAEQLRPACAEATWQRDPLRITFHPAGRDAVVYDLVPGSAVLVEDSDEE